MSDVSTNDATPTVSTNAPANITAPTADPAPAVEPTPVDAPTEPPEGVDTGRFGDWRDQLHEDIRGDDAFKEMKGPDELAHAYLDRSEGFVRKPGGDATDEEVNQFYTDMGVPEDIQEYVDAFKDVEIPEGIEADNQFVADAIDKSSELHMFPFQLQGLMDWYYARLDTMNRELQTAQLKEADDAMQQLKRDWGAEFRVNSAISERAITALGGNELLDWADAKGVSNDPTFLRLMHSIGKNLTEDMVLQGVPVSSGAGEKQTHLTYPNTKQTGQY